MMVQFKSDSDNVRICKERSSDGKLVGGEIKISSDGVITISSWNCGGISHALSPRERDEIIRVLSRF